MEEQIKARPFKRGDGGGRRCRRSGLLATGAEAQPKMEKRSPYPAPNPPRPRRCFRAPSPTAIMLFLSGVGYHKPGTIEDHTRGVLEEIKKNLEDAGSSLQKCLKVSVFLNDLKDYDRMNAVYRSFDWGSRRRFALPSRRRPAFPAIRWSRSTSSPTSEREGASMGLFGKWSRRDLLKSSGAVAGAPPPVAAQAAMRQSCRRIPAPRKTISSPASGSGR